MSLFDKYNCKEISEIVGVTLNQVYEVRKRYNLTNKQNQLFDLNTLQEQIILSGKLGDGYFHQNSKNSICYKESHAEDELEYLTWKMNILGKDMITKSGIRKINKSKTNKQQPYEFSTKASSIFKTYANMTINETINKLNYQGLIMFMLDDGWVSKNNYYISGGILTKENLENLCFQFSKYGIEDVHIVCNNDLKISIPSKNNSILYNMATSFIPENTDIIIKKFKKMKNINVN